MIGTYIDLGSMTSLMSAGSTTVSTSSTTDHNITPDELTTTLSLSTTTAASSPSSLYNTIVMDTTQRYVESLSDDELMRFSELVDAKLNDNSFENNKLITKQEYIPKVKTK